MRGKKKTALVMGSQEGKGSLSSPRHKTWKDSKVRVMIQKGLQLIVMAEMHKEVWGGDQTDRSQYFPLLPVLP